jgi:hypothetical protein
MLLPMDVHATGALVVDYPTDVRGTDEAQDIAVWQCITGLAQRDAYTVSVPFLLPAGIHALQGRYQGGLR